LPAPSLERMCWRPRESLAGTVAYLVRSFRTNAQIRSLTTGTFNRVVKDRIAFRLSGAYSVQPDDLMWDRIFDPVKSSEARPQPLRQHPTVLETLQTYRAAKKPSTEASHRISTRFPHREDSCGDSRPRLSGRAKLDGALVAPKTDRSVGFLDYPGEKGENPHPR
jgi:hypothetical protein